MIKTVPLAQATDVARVGGKAASLGRLIRAGFFVPDGFVIETLAAGATDVAEEWVEAILRSYAAMGGGTVAVRSSATAEDSAAASMAGQFETILNVTSEVALLDAVRQCLASAASERVAAYIAEHAIDPAAVAMAVVVQRQVQADVAGVLFTASPDDAYPRQMLIEAAWGLGESVVSGRVQPDVLRVAFDDGRVLSATIATKTTEFTADGEQAVAADRSDKPCLTARDVHRLWQLARQVEAHFGSPQDLEWAIADDHLYLLQSRPITTHADAALRAGLIQETRNELRFAAATGRGPWVLHNLSETLPHPSPLAWSVVRRFMSGRGGYGEAYRAVGFEPAAELADDGFLDLIGGRIYMDAAKAPRMFWADFPFEYDIDFLKGRPDASQQPPTKPVGSLFVRGAAARRLGRVDATLRKSAADIESRLRATFTDLASYVKDGKDFPLVALAAEGLIEKWTQIEARVMDQFGPNEITAGLVAGQALDDLQRFLAENVWDEDAGALARLLSSGGTAEGSLNADAALYEVGVGRRTLRDWLTAFGHRGVGEFDLASPRWREQPEAARAAAARFAAAEPPAERHHRHVSEVAAKLSAVRATLAPRDQRDLDRLVTAAQKSVVLREDAKDALMLGYDLLRDIALESGRRLGLDCGVFNLSREELFIALRVGYAPLQMIEDRRQHRVAERRLRLPAVIDAATIPTLGEPALPLNATAATALAISAGDAVGPALVVRSPGEAGVVQPGYVLVCPSTDPSWTPLFAGASALVIECGGVLSHGAVVAREMGLPAVVLPDATLRFKTGDVIHVDGTHGRANLATTDATEVATVTADDVAIAPERLPPPAGRKDRAAARLRSTAAAVWTVVLLLFFLLPESLFRQPILAMIDRRLWPAVRTLGWPILIAVIAAATAMVTLGLQRWLTGNRRLVEAKRRAAALQKEATEWPAGSRRRGALFAASSGVSGRVLGASLVSTAILLGPLVILFIWLGERAAPSTWNAPAGSTVRVVAMVDGDRTVPVTLVAPPSIAIDETTPATQELPPLRATLERLLTLYRTPRPPAAGEPWELSIAPDPSRRQAADELASYLDAGLPPQAVSWTLHPPTGFDGTFDVYIDPASKTSGAIGVTVGPNSPPRPATATWRTGWPVRSLKVVYPTVMRPPPFLQVAGFDLGWVGVYVAVYVVALFVVRRLLGVA